MAVKIICLTAGMLCVLFIAGHCSGQITPGNVETFEQRDGNVPFHMKTGVIELHAGLHSNHHPVVYLHI